MQKITKSWTRGFSAAKAARNHAIAPIESKMMGAAIFAGPNVIAFGYNQYGKTHVDSVGYDFNYSTHAEHSALLKIRHYENNRNLVMYIYREKVSGVGSSKPCQMCINRMKEAGIKKARFYDEHGIAQEIKIG